MHRHIRIVLLIDVLTTLAAGSERQVYELVRGVDKELFEVYVCVVHHKDVPVELSNLRCKVWGIGIDRIYSFSGIRAGYAFTRFLRAEKIDIVMTFHFSSDIWGTFFARKAGVPVIISNRRDIGFWQKAYHIWAYRLVNHWVTAIVVNSFAGKETTMLKESVCPEKIKIIHNGIDFQKFSKSNNIAQIKEQLKIDVSDCVIGCVGNLKSVKGHMFLIEALKKVCGNNLKCKLLIIGDGQERENLAKQAQALGIAGNVLLLGSRTDIPQLLSIMDICVLPSLSEGLSNAILEYMAAGKAIVATNVGGNRELITDHETGLLVPAADSLALAEAIITLQQDKSLAARLADAAKTKAQELFSHESMINKYENLFSELCSFRMGVCHLISSNGLFGAERVLLNIVSHSNLENQQSWLIVLRNSHNPHVEIYDEAKKHGISAEVIDSSGRLDFGAVRKISRFVKDNNIGLLHTHNYKSDFVGLFAALQARIPVVATVHGYIGSDRRARFYEAMDRFLLRFFKKVILVDKSLKRWFPGGSKKYIVINNGISTDDLKPQKSQLMNRHKLSIMTVGRLSDEKGHAHLIKAFARAVKEGIDASLYIVGEGDLRLQLQELCKNLGIADNVTFAGYQRDVAVYYASMDIYVSSSLIEHFPLSVLEAMSAGKAIVATNVGGTADLIKDDETGLLIEPGSADAIYMALVKLAGDHSVREKLGSAAQQYVKANYSLEKMLTQYGQVYGEVIRDRA